MAVIFSLSTAPLISENSFRAEQQPLSIMIDRASTGSNLRAPLNRSQQRFEEAASSATVGGLERRFFMGGSLAAVTSAVAGWMLKSLIFNPAPDYIPKPNIKTAESNIEFWPFTDSEGFSPNPKVIIFSEDRKPKLRQMIEECGGRIGCLVHPLYSEIPIRYHWAYKGYSLTGYRAYLRRLTKFLSHVPYPVFILVDSSDFKRKIEWLNKIVPQKICILILTPQLSDTNDTRRWERVFGNLGIQEVVLMGEVADGVEIDRKGNIIKGGDWCIGATYEIFRALKFKIKAAAGNLFFLPQSLLNPRQETGASL